MSKHTPWMETWIILFILKNTHIHKQTNKQKNEWILVGQWAWWIKGVGENLCPTRILVLWVGKF